MSYYMSATANKRVWGLPVPQFNGLGKNIFSSVCFYLVVVEELVYLCASQTQVSGKFNQAGQVLWQKVRLKVAPGPPGRGLVLAVKSIDVKSIVAGRS